LGTILGEGFSRKCFLAIPLLLFVSCIVFMGMIFRTFFSGAGNASGGVFRELFFGYPFPGFFVRELFFGHPFPGLLVRIPLVLFVYVFICLGSFLQGNVLCFSV
jgi:hypothetical protein